MAVTGKEPVFPTIVELPFQFQIAYIYVRNWIQSISIYFKPLLCWIFCHSQSSLNLANRSIKSSKVFCLKRLYDLHQGERLLCVCSESGRKWVAILVPHGTWNKVDMEGSGGGSSASSSVSEDSLTPGCVPVILFPFSPACPGLTDWLTTQYVGSGDKEASEFPTVFKAVSTGSLTVSDWVRMTWEFR
jgi:hypothetical protein